MKSELSNKYWFLFVLSCQIVLMALIILWYVNEFLGFMIAALLLFFSIPAFVISIIGFCQSFSFKTKFHWWIFAFGLANLSLIVIYSLAMSPQRKCNAYIMEEHYYKYSDKMFELKDYFNNAIDDSCYLVLEFDKGKLDMIIYNKNSEELRDNPDSLLNLAGITKQELGTIKQKLEEIECIGVQTGFNDTRIWFRRVGWALYGYCLSDYVWTEEQQERIKMNPISVGFNDSVYFWHAGGAVGSDNFPGKEEFEKVKLKEKTSK